MFKKYQQIMKNSWEKKAQEDAYYFVDSSRKNWNKKDYYNKGEKEVFKYAISFLKKKNFSENDLKKMRALEIGCGTGRLSAALAKYFGLVDGVDISKKMIEIAKRDNAGNPNLNFYVNNGLDLRQFPDNTYDFVFSFLVFQHIPKRSIVINYLKEIYRVLKPGSFMKCQVRGYPGYFPLGLASWRYRGFDSFFIALSEIRRIPLIKIPFLKIKKYDTLFGAFFKKEEMVKIMKEIRYSDIEVFYDRESVKYLWVSGRK